MKEKDQSSIEQLYVSDEDANESGRGSERQRVQKGKKKISKEKENMKKRTKGPDNDISQSKIKKDRKTSGVKLGRPRKTKDVDYLIQNPTIQAQQCILEYLSKIGLSHGLVFSPEHRIQLNKEMNKKLQWKECHFWDPQIERDKIISNSFIRDTIGKFSEKMRIDADTVIGGFLLISDIVADQCTEDIYILLSWILQSIIEPDTVEIQERAKELLLSGLLVFLPGDFTNIKIKYYLELTNDKSLIENQFVEMFKRLRTEIRALFEKTKGIAGLESYLNQQRTMNEQLLQIIEKFKNKIK